LLLLIKVRCGENHEMPVSFINRNMADDIHGVEHNIFVWIDATFSLGFVNKAFHKCTSLRFNKVVVETHIFW
jgi:hypothetical protein